MARWIQSFRYNRYYTREWFIRFFDEMAGKLRLKLVSRHWRNRVLFPNFDPDAAAAEIFSPQRREELRRLGLLRLDRRRVAQLCARVRFQELLYENAAGTTRLAIQTARRNEFPSLSSDVWIDDEIRWPAGFIDVTARPAVIQRVRNLMSLTRG